MISLSMAVNEKVRFRSFLGPVKTAMVWLKKVGNKDSASSFISDQRW